MRKGERDLNPYEHLILLTFFGASTPGNPLGPPRFVPGGDTPRRLRYYQPTRPRSQSVPSWSASSRPSSASSTRSRCRWSRTASPSTRSRPGYAARCMGQGWGLCPMISVTGTGRFTGTGGGSDRCRWGRRGTAERGGCGTLGPFRGGRFAGRSAGRRGTHISTGRRRNGIPGRAQTSSRWVVK